MTSTHRNKPKRDDGLILNLQKDFTGKRYESKVLKDLKLHLNLISAGSNLFYSELPIHFT